MALNAKQRAKWLADIISDVQRYKSKNAEEAEAALMERVLSLLGEARKCALDDVKEP